MVKFVPSYLPQLSMWVLGIESGSSCFQNKYFTNFPTSSVFYTLTQHDQRRELISTQNTQG